MWLKRALENRATVLLANPRDPVLANWWGLSGMTDAGISVTPETALKLTAVMGCVRILTESIATLPLSIWRRIEKGGREEATNHPLWKLYQYGPNEEQTTFDWVEMMVGHLALRGNAYNQLIYPEAGPLAGMIPLHPDRMRPFRSESGAIFYAYQPKDGDKVVFDASEVLHFSIFSDGLKGRSIIDYNREAIGLGLAAEQFGARFFQNGATTSGVLSHPQQLSKDARENIKKSFSERHQGSQNANRWMLLEEGMKWEQIGVNPDEAQFLETRKFQTAEIARMFRVPPHMLADLDRATFNNIEQLSQEFVTYTLMPWTTRLTKRMDKDLLTDTGKKTFYTDFDFRVMLKADGQARGQLATAMFNTGAYSPNDIRRGEGENPVDGGDQRYVPLNMVPVGIQPQDGQDPQGKAAQRYEPLFRAAWQRIVTAEVRGLRRSLDGGMTGFKTEVNGLLSGFKPLARRHLLPVVESVRLLAMEPKKLDAAAFVDETVRQHISDLAQDITEAQTEENIRAVLDSLDQEGVSDIIERESIRAVLWAVKGQA